MTRRRGFILLTVLWIVLVASIALASWHRTATVRAHLVSRRMDALVADSQARAVAEVVRIALSRAVLTDSVYAYASLSYPGCTEGYSCSIAVSDEGSRLNVNTASRETLRTLVSVTERDVGALMHARPFYGDGDLAAYAGWSPETAAANARLVGFFAESRPNINLADKTQLAYWLSSEEGARVVLAARAGPDGREGTEDDTPIVSVGQLSEIFAAAGWRGQMPKNVTFSSRVVRIQMRIARGETNVREYVIITDKHGVISWNVR